MGHICPAGHERVNNGPGVTFRKTRIAVTVGLLTFPTANERVNNGPGVTFRKTRIVVTVGLLTFPSANSDQTERCCSLYSSSEIGRFRIETRPVDWLP